MARAIALVTASAKRLGASIAQRLAARGFDLALHYSSSGDEAQALAQKLRSQGARAEIFQADLSLEAESQALMPTVTAGLGAPSLLVNNAARFERDEALDATRESWDRHLEVNLRAPFVLSQALVRHLPQGERGLIINMLDTRVLNLTGHFTSYTLSKAGLHTLTQTLALAFAPEIRVNGIAPGFTLPSPDQSQDQFDEKAAKQPLARAVTPEEIGGAVDFIIDSPSMTGQVLALDAGQHLNWKP